MKLRPFELILVVGFGVLMVLALILLANYKPAEDDTIDVLNTPVTIWGTVPYTVFAGVLRSIAETNESFRNVEYVEKDARTFDDELINALALDRGPDVLFLPHEEIVQYRDKIQPLTYEQYPKRDFESAYIDGATIFALGDGIYALPVAVDPIVLYWNRDLLATKNFLSAPKTWEELVTTMLPALIERDFNRTITRAGIAFGEYQNVTNAYGVLSTLLLQGGSAMVTETYENKYSVSLNSAVNNNSNDVLSKVVVFYTNFSNPINPLYTWNRAQPNDFQAFGREDLALYFGRGSEARLIEQQNPNLNFDIAEVPQSAAATVRRTYGTFYGLALMRAADNKPGGVYVMQTLASGQNAASLADGLAMSPVYRQLVAAGSNDRYGRIIYNSAPIARGWLSPDVEAVRPIFTKMIEDVQSNRQRPEGAASDAVNRLRGEY
jgi:ABC-type glycerol-3-phosphate transport system substrate-binding protein